MICFMGFVRDGKVEKVMALQVTAWTALATCAWRVRARCRWPG